MRNQCLAGLALACAITHASALAQRGAIVGTVRVADAPVSGGGLYLVSVAGAASPAVAPMAVDVDQRDLRFVPRVIAVPPGSHVSFLNSDPVMHNVFHPSPRLPGFDLGMYPQKESRSFTFGNEGAFLILCHVHPEMVGYIVVVASPYRAVSDDDGRFRMEGVLPGIYRLRTWHRRLKPHEQTVTVAADGVVHIDLSLAFGSPTEPRTSDRQGPQ